MGICDWQRFAACGLAALVLCACAPDAPPSKPAAGTAATASARAVLGEADSVVGCVKVVLLELKREGADALLVRWQFRNESDRKIEVVPLSTAGMNPWRLSRGVSVRDAAGNQYPLLQEASTPQAAKHEDFTFAAHFAPRQVVDTWARVKAPPASVQTVDVLLPAAAPIRAVPIKASGGA